MRYVQYWPPEVEPVPDSGEVRPKWRVIAIRKIAERILPPLIFRRPPETPAMPAINQYWVPRPYTVENERRKLCRRVNDAPILQELRSGRDRRRRNQRRDDITTAIDEKV